MFDAKYLFYFILLHLIIATPQINLYYTDRVSESDTVLQHDCLRLGASNYGSNDDQQIMLYCMSESSSKFHVENNDFFPKFTFAELSKQNITSQQLYLWSTPIDIIEHYQFYLNQLSTSDDLSLATEVFYNCTMPRFGPMCQYELPYHYSHHSSLSEIIHDFYSTYGYNPTNFTCYTHLQCNRGRSPVCLDWSEICNGHIDCLDGAFDEEYCWQLEINECKDNEYRCMNGQCIPQLFVRDNRFIPDCIDASDETTQPGRQREDCYIDDEPSLGCEDMTCKRTPLISTCVSRREDLLMKAMHSSTDNSVSKDCWSAFKCILRPSDSDYLSCNELCAQFTCLETIKNSCSNVMFFPNGPVLFDDVYFAYTKNDSQYLTNFNSLPLYICYNKSHYDDIFMNASKIFFNNMKCVDSEPFLSRSNQSYYSADMLHVESIYRLNNLIQRYQLLFNYTSTICNRSTMYQCVHSSKCISAHRLIDNVYDCPHMDDENMAVISSTDLMKQIEKTHFKCQTSDTYIFQNLIDDGKCDCKTNELVFCDDEPTDFNYITRDISFQTICDGFVELSPLVIDNRNETDETECEQWQCNNIYTRCNYIWNCPNGEDETGCVSHSVLNCSSKHHLCISPDENQFICLPIEKVNDGNVDCLGGTDERTLCRKITGGSSISDDFYCRNQKSQSCIHFTYLCNDFNECEHGDDEQFCTTNRTYSPDDGVCVGMNYAFASEVERFFCAYSLPNTKMHIVDFQLPEMSKSVKDRATNIRNTVFSNSPMIKMSNQHQPRCHRGLDLRVWLNNKINITNTCLCPPSFYGDICEYQNQRISLAIKFRALSDSWQTLFAIVISLIDDSDNRIIHSNEQFTYLSARDCKTKFNMNLLYSTRPKHSTKSYAIHIDIYEKISLTYRTSLLFPVIFPFLPVHRLAFIVDIPLNDNKARTCSNAECIHGKCIKYSNNPKNVTFCQCDRGWSGRYCTIQHTCTCASDSFCIGVSANNRSICVCPIHKFGSRCLLTNTICQNNDNSTCQNRGQCIPNDDYIVFNAKFACICPEGFSGDRCEIAGNKLVLSFEKSIILSQSLVIHFVDIMDYTSKIPVSTTTFRTIPVGKDSVTIYWSRPFHLVFTEFFNKNYYLTVVQKTYNESATIIKMINPSDRCPHIRELFNKTFVQWHLVRRIKYYHLSCQKQSLNLSCFYDDVHFCLCYNFEQQRLANCFKFNHNMTFNCLGQSACENDAQCFQDDPNCPKRSMCICSPCFFGTRCQFSTSGFGLSLDPILGYHILPHVSLNHQPLIIKTSLALTIIFIVVGFINGIFSLITFKNKAVRQVGCGLYLLGSSITTLLTMIMFGLKFTILILTQMALISNRSFLQVQCISLDFILRVCLYMDQWLNACVAYERAITAVKGTRFVKKKSKQAAKLIITILLIVIIGTSIHDPIYRRLIDEVNDDDDIKRLWCTITYPPNLQIYNYIMHTFHFFGPFLINFISAVILIIKKSYQELHIHPERTFKNVLREQFQQHKHLLTAPIVLVILAIPRLIITFASKCMKSTGDAWLFLAGYFISFIPPMLTFVVFIVPSKFYKKEFRKSVREYQTNIQRRLHLIS